MGFKLGPKTDYLLKGRKGRRKCYSRYAVAGLGDEIV